MNWSNVYIDPLYKWGVFSLPLFVLLYSFSLTRDFVGSLVVAPNDFHNVFDLGKGIYEQRYGYEANLELFVFSNFTLHFLFLEFVFVIALTVFRSHIVPIDLLRRRETRAFVGVLILCISVLCLQPSYACDVILSGCFSGYVPWTMLISFALLAVVLVPVAAGVFISLPKLIFSNSSG